MSIPPHLTVSVVDPRRRELLGYWSWLVSDTYEPVLMTAFGDWILASGDGRVHLLSMLDGDIAEIAPNLATFLLQASDVEYQDEWFLAGLVDRMVADGVHLLTGQCYGFKTPPVLGAPIGPDNVAPIDIVVYHSIMSQLHRQIAENPDQSITGFQFTDED